MKLFIVLVGCLCLQATHGFFGLPVNSKFTMNLSNQLKKVSTSISPIISSISKVETQRNLLDIEALVPLEHDLITIRLFFISFKSFTDNLNAIIMTTSPNPGFHNLSTKIAIEALAINAFRSKKASVANVKKITGVIFDDFVPNSDTIAILFNGFLGIHRAAELFIGEPKLTSDILESSFKKEDKNVITKIYLELIANNAKLLERINFILSQFTVLVNFQAATSKEAQAYLTGEQSLIAKELAAIKQFQPLFKAALDNEIKVKRKVISEMEVHISSLNYVLNISLTSTFYNTLETFFEAYNASAVKSMNSIQQTFIDFNDYANSSTGGFGDDVKKLVSEVSRRVFSTSAEKVIACLPVYQPDFVNAFKLANADGLQCCSDSCLAAVYAYDNFIAYLSVISDEITERLNYVQACLKQINKKATKTTIAKRSACIAQKLVFFKTTSELLQNVALMTSNVLLEVAEIGQSDFETCYYEVLESNVLGADFIYYLTVFDVCSGWSEPVESINKIY